MMGNTDRTFFLFPNKVKAARKTNSEEREPFKGKWIEKPCLTHNTVPKPYYIRKKKPQSI